MHNKSNSYAIFLAGAVVLGAVLRLWNIQQGFWWDEIWSTMRYARTDSVWEVISTLGFYFNNHVLYSLLCMISIHVLGESELTARLPSLLFGLAGIPVLFFLGKRLTDTATSCIACCLLAISSFHIDHSTEARGYTGLMLFAMLSSIYFLRSLRSEKRLDWFLFGLFTFLGFYTHVFMAGVSLSQTIYIISIYCIASRKTMPDAVSFRVCRQYAWTLTAAALCTLLAYAPMLDNVFTSLAKVRTVDVDRIPFLFETASALMPGILSGFGLILYGFLVIAGLWRIFMHRGPEKPVFAGLYFIIIMFVPYTMYLLINPMFVFERYFIFTLPFFLLAVSSGMQGLIETLPKISVLRIGTLVLLLLLIGMLQAPFIRKTISCDRQNYREAVRYVEQKKSARKKSYVFSLGWAGHHFEYYASVPVKIPATFEEFIAAIDRADESWCLVTAWLPMLRPPHEDISLYTEPPAHEKIYSYVQRNFTKVKSYNTEFPTYIYRMP